MYTSINDSKSPDDDQIFIPKQIKGEIKAKKKKKKVKKERKQNLITNFTYAFQWHVQQAL